MPSKRAAKIVVKATNLKLPLYNALQEPPHCTEWLRQIHRLNKWHRIEVQKSYTEDGLRDIWNKLCNSVSPGRETEFDLPGVKDSIRQQLSRMPQSKSSTLMSELEDRGDIVLKPSIPLGKINYANIARKTQDAFRDRTLSRDDIDSVIKAHIQFRIERFAKHKGQAALKELKEDETRLLRQADQYWSDRSGNDQQ